MLLTLSSIALKILKVSRMVAGEEEEEGEGSSVPLSLSLGRSEVCIPRFLLLAPIHFNAT